ncbi:Sybindin-like protein, partial [Phlyctochytrium arcticum]
QIYNLYIFDRHCHCISFTSWIRPSAANNTTTSNTANSSSAGPTSTSTAQAGKGVTLGVTGMSLEEEAKLVYGVVFSLRNLVNKLISKPGEGFLSYKTNAYRLHYFETPTGLKFVMNTDPHMDSMRETLRTIYSHIYVEYVTRNPLHTFDTPIRNDLFRQNLQKYVRSLPGFE